MLADVPIADVWRALGGGPLRHDRGRAFWRDGDGYSVALDTENGIWYDHARGGGGVLTLVATALNTDKAEALAWLQREQFIEPSRKFTPAERREFAEGQGQAARAAAGLTEWRTEHLSELRRLRDCHLLCGRIDHVAGRVLIEPLATKAYECLLRALGVCRGRRGAR